MTKKATVLAVMCAGLLHAQVGRTTDWYALGGDSERDGWEKNEERFFKDDVKDFRLLWQRKLDNSEQGTGALLPPVVLGNLIGYRGFKELAFVAGSKNNLWAIDSDLDRIYWSKQFEEAKKKKSCGGDLTAAPVLPGAIVFRSSNPARKRRRSSDRFAHPQPVYLLTGDGLLHALNQSDGSEMNPPIQFVPSGVPAKALNISEDTIYTSTSSACGQPAAIWALDIGDVDAKVKSIQLGADAVGSSGVVIASNGTAFVQTGEGPLDPDNGKFGDALVELDRDLKVSGYFVMPAVEGKKHEAGSMNALSPVVFSFKGQDIVVTANRDGRLYVLKAPQVGSEDHHHYLSKSVVLPTMDGNKAHGIWGGLSSWEDADGSRYVLAPVWGPVSSEIQSAVPGVDAPNGSVVSFKVEDKGGVPTLTPVWVSRDLESPVPPVIAKGLVFALSNGKFSISEKKGKLSETPKRGSHAALYAFDGASGKQLYTTGDQVTTPGNLAGMSMANGRVYFVTVDNTVQVFGKYLEP